MTQHSNHQVADEKQYEERLRRRLKLLKKEFDAGNVVLNADLKVIDSLKAVRYGADGEVDLNTVDGLVRSLALAVEGIHYREETKKIISLQDLQRGYFQNIESLFGSLYEDMKRARVAPFQVGTGVSRDPEGMRIFSKAIPDVLAWAENLWKEAHEIAHTHAEDLDGLKGVFGGETFPQGYKNIVSCTGIYIDTNILPDPFLRSKIVLTGADRAMAVRTLVTNALSLLHYKEAALAELEVPIVAIIPDLLFLDRYMYRQVKSAAAEDTLSHLKTIFGIQFANLEEAQHFTGKLETPADVVRRVVDPSRLIFDLDDRAPVESQIENYIATYLKPSGYQMGAGQAVLLSTIGRMSQANDLLFRSARLRGVPIIDAPTSWQYFNWKLSYGSERHDPEMHFRLHMTKALQSAASGEMEWLGAVPVKVLVEMRKHDVLPELRSILSSGVKELIDLRPDNFYRTSDQVVDNMQKAFDEHRKKLSALTGKKWRFAGVELASCIVKGAVQVASACGVPVVSLVNVALDQAVDVPKMKQIPGRIRALRHETKELRSSAVGMLFQVAQNPKSRR